MRNTPCTSCKFGTTRRRHWGTKGKKPGSIRKGTDNKLGYTVSVDELQLDQQGLLPQFSGKIKSARIWSAQVVVGHFSDLTYVDLMRSKIQEKTLAGKVHCEMWAATFGVNVHIYHSDNGRFDEQPFRSEVEDFNQTRIIWGVGSHHQNAIVEKNQTLTLGDNFAGTTTYVTPKNHHTCGCPFYVLDEIL